MHESRRSAAARGSTWWQPSALNSLQSSCPRYSDLHRGLSPRLSIYPINQSIHPSIHPPVLSIDQSASLSPSHSIHPSIHPLLPALLSHVLRPASRFKLAAQHISNPSIHPSIHRSARSIDESQSIYLLRRVTHVVSSRRLAAINQAIHHSQSITIGLNPIDE